MATWTLDDAVTLIRSVQPAVMQAGYYMALAGGVLNKGTSLTDLDLVIVPRTPQTTMADADVLNTLWGRHVQEWDLHNALVRQFVLGEHTVEVVIIKQKEEYINAVQPTDGNPNA